MIFDNNLKLFHIILGQTQIVNEDIHHINCTHNIRLIIMIKMKANSDLWERFGTRICD